MKLPFCNIYMYYSRCCGKKDTIFVLLTFAPYGINKGKKFSDIWEKNRKCLELSVDTIYASLLERWPSGRRRSPAKGVGLKRLSRVRISSSPPSIVIKAVDCVSEFCLSRWDYTSHIKSMF